MRGDKFFYEEQKFNQRWLFGLLYSIFIITLAVTVFAFIKESLSAFSLIPVILVAGLILLFNKMKLITRIDENKIEFKFFPFHIKNQVVWKKDIKSVSVITYKPFADYGGWGVRFGKYGKAYTTSGTYAMHLVYNNGKSVLLGTSSQSKVLSFLKENNYIVV